MWQLIVVSFLWAFSFGLVKRYLPGIDSTLVAAARLGLALLVFLPFLRFRGLTPRLTLTLPRIVAAGFLALHIEGDEKRATFDRATGDGPELPIRAVLDASPRPVEVFWAP